MQFYGDYHIHTLYSDGRATVREMIEAAHLKGLSLVGLADHGPRNIGTGIKNSQVYLEIKEEVKIINKEYIDLDIKVGAEANIIGLQGELDVSEDVIKKLDYLLVGLHPYVLPQNINSAWKYVLGNQLGKLNKGQREKVKNINTKTLIESINKHKVLAITHPGLKMSVDYKELALACVKTNTALEINTGHKWPSLKDVLTIASTGVNFIVNSDAHFPETVGELDYGAYVLKKANVPPERILNAVKD